LLEIKNMENKIKKIIHPVLIIVFIILLGFSPVTQPTLLSLKWENLGMKMVEAGVIDAEKFPNFYNEKELTINSDNAHTVLNTLWALGLSNKNSILENGPMMDKQYGSAGNFASTGGWTLSKGNAMDHYSMHSFITLTPEQQALVEQVAKNIYRPCCNNSTYFPDCNHGMAMLGLLELLASQGKKEAEMYKIAEEVNGYWFPKVEKVGCSI